MRARAPASAANLGPGFDTLALALQLYVEVEVEAAPRLTVRAEGEGAELAGDASHLAARIAIEVLGHDQFAIAVRSQIPVGRGLGSSAALAVATAAAAGADDPLAVAAAADGHPENAAASVRGGLVAATMVAGDPVVAPLALDPELAFVVLVPSRTLATGQARQALPATVSHRDASFNLGRMGLLVGGLANRRHLERAATEDRLHQAARSPLFPEASQLLRRLVDAGALAASWSGAGPGLIGFCDAELAPRVRDAGEVMLKECSVHGRALLLEADRRGLLVAKGGSPPPGASATHRWP